MRIFGLLLLATAALTAPLGELSAKEASGSAVITAHVPAVCEIATDNFVATDDGTVTGSVLEYCNTSTSYQIIATHRPLASSETAEIRYGQERTFLRQTGLTAVAMRFGQRFERVGVEIQTQELAEPLAVSFSVTAV